MFMRYRIMRIFKWNNLELSMEELHHSLHFVGAKRFSLALYSLVKDGFLKINPDGIVTPFEISSFRDYKLHATKVMFNFLVSLSAIVVAITSVITLLK